MLKNIEHLKGEMLDKIDLARGLIARAKTENRALTDEEQKRHNSLMIEIRSLEKEIADETELQNREAKKLRGDIKNGTAEATGPEYRKLFNTGGDNGGFATFNEFLAAVEMRDPRLARRDFTGFESGTPGLGGDIVPTEWAEFLLDGSLGEEIVRPRARVYPMGAQTVKIPAWDGLDRSSGAVYGGFSGEWLGELEEATPVEGAVRNIELKARKLAIYTAASREVLQDGITFEQQLKSALVDSIGFFLDKAFLTGTGGTNDQPLGVTGCTSAVTETRQETGEVCYTDLVNMYASLYKGLPGRPVWICSHEVLPELLGMVDEDNRLIWQPNARDGAPSYLFGYPLIVTEKTGLDLGDTGDIMLVNFRGYAVGLRAEVAIEASNAPGWLKDRIDFRIIIRADGAELFNGPVKTESGKELSWAVLLGPKGD